MSKQDKKPARAARRARPQIGVGATAHSVESSARRLPVLGPARRQVPCLSCALCCSYVGVGIDDPSTLRGATNILWYLYHQNVGVYVEDGEWMVQLETRCRQLQDDNRCGIYETRPQICREFDETSCEVNAEEVGTVFYTARDFLAYLEQHHKRIHTLVRKRYLPPDAALNGHRAGRAQPGPFQPRFEALRQLGEGEARPSSGARAPS
jgi:Fe-S-cluster containining protein